MFCKEEWRGSVDGLTRITWNVDDPDRSLHRERRVTQKQKCLVWLCILAKWNQDNRFYNQQRRVFFPIRMKFSSYRGKFEVLRTYSSLSSSCWPCSRLKMFKICFHSRWCARLSTVNACLPQPYWSAPVNAHKVYQEYLRSCSPRMRRIEQQSFMRVNLTYGIFRSP